MLCWFKHKTEMQSCLGKALRLGWPCRRQLWGSSAMAEHFFKDTKCWLEHMTLHQKTGMDPEGIKLRSAQGFSAIDYFMPGYHVWQKLLENLADLG